MTESGKAQELKGKAKEAAGAVRGDEEQKREGRADQAAGKARQAGEKVRDAAEDVKDAAKRQGAAQRAAGPRAEDGDRWGGKCTGAASAWWRRKVAQERTGGGRPRRSRCRRSASGPGRGPMASRRARKRPAGAILPGRAQTRATRGADGEATRQGTIEGEGPQGRGTRPAEAAAAARLEEIDWKNYPSLRRFVSERGKIRSRRITGLSRRQQSLVADGREARPHDGPAGLPGPGSQGPPLAPRPAAGGRRARVCPRRPAGRSSSGGERSRRPCAYAPDNPFAARRGRAGGPC